MAAPGVLANDTDADNDPLTAVLETDVSNGALTLIEDGSFGYLPKAGFIGNDSFTYFANDGQVNSDTAATVTITVTPTRQVAYPPNSGAALQPMGPTGNGAFENVLMSASASMRTMTRASTF